MASAGKGSADKKKRLEESVRKRYGPYCEPSEEGLRIGHININGLRQKLNIVTAFIHSHQFDIFVIGESRLSADITDNEVNIPGYTMSRYDRPSAGGGLAIYVRRTQFIESREKERKTFATEDGTGEGTIQYLSIEITKPIKCELAAVYRPVDQEASTLYNFMNDQLAQNERKRMVFIGDFNIEIKTRLPQKIQEMKTTYKLEQYIEYPTRVSGDGPNITSSFIDLIFTNFKKDKVLESGIIRSAISDHDLIYCTLKINDKCLDSKLFDVATDLGKICSAVQAIPNESFGDVKKAIHKAAKYMGPIHGSYSSPQCSSGVMSQAVTELSDAKWDFLKEEIPGNWVKVGEMRNNHLSSKNIIECRMLEKLRLAASDMAKVASKSFIQKELRECLKDLLLQYIQSVGDHKDAKWTKLWLSKESLINLLDICNTLRTFIAKSQDDMSSMFSSLTVGSDATPITVEEIIFDSFHWMLYARFRILQQNQKPIGYEKAKKPTKKQ